MNNMIRSLINILPTKLQLILSKLYFARLLKKQRLLSSEVEYEMLDSWIKQGDNCLDIGANIGRYTFKMSKIVGQKGHVFSFEPMHYQFHILTHLCSSSNYNNISLFNVAIGDKHKMVGMNVQYLPEKHSAIFDTNTASHISFDCKRKDTLCIPIDSIDLPVKINLAKIDVEGYEIHVLHGMKKMIKRDRPVLIVENNSIDINQFLLEMGYEMTKMDENSRNEVYIFNN